MRKKVCICSTCSFPRGSASANYIQYLAQALLEDVEIEVILISYGNVRECNSHCNDTYTYKGIKFINISGEDQGIFHKIKNKYIVQRIFIDKLKTIGLTKNDAIIVYSSNFVLVKSLLNYIKSKNLYSAACVVEWFGKEDITKNILSIKYYKYTSYFKKLLPKFDIVFPISSYLEKHLIGLGCNTMVLPIMADPYEYMNKCKSINSTIKFIVISNGRKKDELQNAIIALGNIMKNDSLNIEAHFKGFRESDIENYLDIRTEKLINKIFIHGWMDYQDLTELYYEMDFIVLPRKENQMTLSNFPSKIPEVMCFGVIPIVSQVGDYTNIYLKDGYDSVFINGHTISDCELAILKAINMGSKLRQEMSENARNTTIEKFFYKKWSTQIVDALFERNDKN